ncbi:MAG: hypothetical protein FIA92_07045 [Chloroflexi bacterium]|nr:hypothetical protein [Chloroflexota bacterium]
MNPCLDWTAFPTGLIADCQGRLGAMAGYMHRLAGDRTAGPALTVQVVAGENGTIHRALLSTRPGDVLVIDAGGYRDRAVWGEVLARAALKRGVAGVVIDGAVRDVDRLRQLGLPTWACGATPAGPHKGWTGRIGAPIACAGVNVSRGDTIVGDADGIVVIPAATVDVVYRGAVERRDQEAQWLRRIEAGESTVTILGINEEAEHAHGTAPRGRSMGASG